MIGGICLMACESHKDKLPSGVRNKLAARVIIRTSHHLFLGGERFCVFHRAIGFVCIYTFSKNSVAVIHTQVERTNRPPRLAKASIFKKCQELSRIIPDLLHSRWHIIKIRDTSY